VDYLLIAKPVAINHLRIRHDCADILWMLCWLCVVLFEDHDLCCSLVTGRSVSEICEIGEQGVSFAGSDLLVHISMECISRLHLNLQLLMTNSCL
jgi:hypothetical protein